MRIHLTLAIVAAAGCDAPDKGAAPAPAPGAGTGDEAERTAVCRDGRCMAVPEGIRGLAFGMTRDQARRAIGRLRLRKAAFRTVVSGDCRERVKAPGIRVRAVTSIGSENAICELWFLGDGVGLSMIDCDLDKRRTRKEHTETVWLLYQSLARQYGQAHSLSDRLMDTGRLKAIWSSDAAELILTASLRNRRSSIELLNRSASYIKAIDAQVEALRAACEAEARARERAKKEEERRLRERARSFEKDLRPPLERPR